MSMKADEIKLDIDELTNLLQQANRKRIKDVINLEIIKLQTDLDKLLEQQKNTSTKPHSATSNSSQKCYEVKLTNYGWEQTNTTVKLYVTLENVRQLPKEAVVCNFTEKSLDLRVLGLENRNYSLTINNLCEQIDVSKSNVKVKTDTVIVSLAKKVPKQWSHVTGVEKRIKESKASSIPDVAEDGDPGASIMNLMKKMYQEGNDEMKQTIAKAWTESQEKKTALSDF
ncbi:PREDICTED: calcyclin-binding protein [Dufourea novaeangliae]|uniref:calcyclin-binding protein n=1 Tax=Dufourea novaeangliae TaxID=178035 RepID=UPI0007673BEA|nr:PREDICTED: calcyclin-binding protein [Dufourea novaeangliae]